MQVEDPKELEKIRQKEMDITRDRINCLVKAGANVFLTTKARAGTRGVRRCSRSMILPRAASRVTGLHT